MFRINPNNNSFNPNWKHELVEIIIPADQKPKRINFPDLQNLRNVHITALKTYTNENFKNTLNGTEVITLDNLQNCWLTLQLYNGKEFIHQEPLRNYWAYQFQAIQEDFIGQKVNYPKSYIEILDIPTSNVDRAIVISIYYAEVIEIEKRDLEFEFKKDMR